MIIYTIMFICHIIGITIALFDQSNLYLSYFSNKVLQAWYYQTKYCNQDLIYMTSKVDNN